MFSFACQKRTRKAPLFRGARDDRLRYPASTSRLERRSCPADRCPNSSSLHPPQAAVVAVARKGLLAPFRPQRGCRNGKKLAASLNAFFSFLRFTALPMVLRFAKLYEKRTNVPHGTLALSPHLCAAAVGMRTVYSIYPSRSSRCAVAGTPLSVIRRMAWSMVFTKMRTSFTIEMR